MKTTESDGSLSQPVTHFDLLSEQIRSIKSQVSGQIESIKSQINIIFWIMGIGFTGGLAMLAVIIARLFQIG